MHFAALAAASTTCMLVLQAVNAGALLLSTYVATRMMKRIMYPDTSGKDAEQKRLARALGINVKLTVHEAQLAAHITLPQQIDVQVDDVAGLDAMVRDLRSDAQYQSSFAGAGASAMLSGSRGLLLYGPPGTGKTMTAKVRPSVDVCQFEAAGAISP